jgi:hypothetical protein
LFEKRKDAMDKQLFSLAMVYLILALGLSACGPAQPFSAEPAAMVVSDPVIPAPVDGLGSGVEDSAAGPVESEPSPASRPLSPLEVTTNFYAGYLAAEDPLSAGSYRQSPYLSAEMLAYAARLVEQNQEGPGADPFLLAQAFPQDFRAELVFEQGNQAQAVVHLKYGENLHDLAVNLVRKGADWKIDSLRAGNPLTPEGVTRLFYDGYLDFARNGGNPLASRAYRDSPYLSEAMVEQVDEILEGFEGGGYDPFLLAQDLPQSIFIEAPEVDGEMAAVPVSLFWSGSPESTWIMVNLQKIGGTWQIVGVAPGNREEGYNPYQYPATPSEVVEVFYASYLIYPDETGGNPLHDRFYAGSPYVTPAFVQEIDTGVAQMGDLGAADPVLCAQDLPVSITVTGEQIDGPAAAVAVSSGLTGHTFTVHLLLGDQGWRIDQVECGR